MTQPRRPSSEPPVLGPEHEVHAEPERSSGEERSDEEGRRDGAPTYDEEIPVLGPEHEVHEELERSSGEERSDEEGRRDGAPIYDEDIPVLGLEHVVVDEEDDFAVLVPDRRAPEPEEALESEGEAHEPEPEAPEQADAPPDEEASRNYRQIYEAKFRPTERDARVAAARTAEGSELLALCLDHDPQVIHAIFENSLAGLDHARMVAAHHKNPVGLEMIVKRADFLRDTQVQRQLVRNGQLTESLMRRVLVGKPLRDVYKTCIDREVPERNRVFCRGILRSRFASSQAEDRASLVIATEGRCLTFLVGQTFDAKTTAILCGKQFNSVLFIQNLARFPACPPVLLAHLLKQPFVRRHAPLKKVILQHPNLPSQVKRNA